MARINLRDLFPEYELDCFIVVENGDTEAFKARLTKEIADVYIEFQREENAYQRKQRRKKATYTLCSDKFENDVINSVPAPFEEYVNKLTQKQLYDAIDSLPAKQSKRIYAHYILGLSQRDIAKKEKVSTMSVNESIAGGLKNLEKYLNFFL